jgi:hypothetical protein
MEAPRKREFEIYRCLTRLALDGEPISIAMTRFADFDLARPGRIGVVAK